MATAVAPKLQDDHEAVRSALTLGWRLRELSGLAKHPNASNVASPQAFPLSFELTTMARVQAVGKAVQELAETLELSKLEIYMVGSTQPETNPSQKLGNVLKDVKMQPSIDEQTEAKLHNVLTAWDQATTEHLASTSSSRLAAYELGKGLSTFRWISVSTSDRKGDGELKKYLDRTMLDHLTRQAQLLAPYFERETVHAVATSLWVWHQVAQRQNDLNDQAEDVYDAIIRQSGIWHDLLLRQLEPGVLLTPADLLTTARRAWPFIKRHWGVALLAILGVIAAAIGVAVLVDSGLNPEAHAAGAFGTVLGLVGLTVTGLFVRAKETTSRLTGQIQSAIYINLVAMAATSLPAGLEKRVKSLASGRDLSKAL